MRHLFAPIFFSRIVYKLTQSLSISLLNDRLVRLAGIEIRDGQLSFSSDSLYIRPGKRASPPGFLFSISLTATEEALLPNGVGKKSACVAVLTTVGTA